MIGEKVGHFTVKQKLGEGGMGAVYIGEHDVMRKKVAVKVLLPQWTQNAMIVQRFINEAIAMGALEHPNIVSVTDCGQLANGSWYIVMEYLDGGTLGKFCAARGPIAPHLALQILAQVAAGLEAAHRRGIVHRDLKPENIFLTTKKVKILDWGISKLGEQDGGGITNTGMVAGTPAYMAPEQMRDLRTVDRRSDVYALGVIAYQMVSGGWLPYQRQDRPEEFANLSAPAIHHLQLTETPIDPRQRVATINDRWSHAILTAIHPDPARRPQSARAFALMLAAATPGDGYLPPGIDVVREYAEELLEIGNLEETVRGSKPSGTRPASRYRFGDQLGAGGMAEVFRATQVGAEGFSRAVAVKRVLPGFSTVPQFASMFVQEAKLASLLDHPNIVSVLDFDRDEEGRLFLAMEYVDGRDLATVAGTGRLPFSATIFIITEALRGLGYAHNLPTANGPRGVIHRDVSPQNVLVSWEGAVKVSDFGIAKAREATAATASTMIKGKPQYMSPEQANGEPLDGRSDLFAIGIMLWELLAGRRLFDGSTHEALAQIVLGRIAPPSTVAADVPRDLEAVAMRLLARDRSARYANAELAIEDLARCADAPRNGRSELARLLAERFPDAVAARTSRPPVAAASGQPADAQSRVTVREQPPQAAVTRRDESPQPTPVISWPSNTTLGGAASQSVVPVARTRRHAPWIAAALTVVVGAGVAIAFVGLRKPQATATQANGAPPATPPVQPMLTITTAPTAAIVRVDGTERGPSPVTLPFAHGQQIAIEAVRDGYEPTRLTVTMEREAQSVLLTLRSLQPAPLADAGATTAGAVAPDARAPTTTVTKPPKRPAKPTSDPRRPTSGDTKFNPDDAVGD